MMQPPHHFNQKSPPPHPSIQKRIATAITITAIAAATTFAQAQEADPSPTNPYHVQPHRIGEEPLTIDGILDESSWAQATVISNFTQVEPTEGAPPTHRTEVRLLYNENYLYVGFTCFDAEPDLIRATQMRRDADVSSDDRVTIAIDPIFDRRNGYFFQVNAAGAKVDALIENNSSLRRDWDGIWYARTKITEQGWTAEFAIPYKTIAFNPKSKTWGINLERTVARNDEVIRWASPTLNTSIVNIGSSGHLESIQDINQGLGLDFKPYALFQFGHTDNREENFVEGTIGFDLFYKITPSLTASLTFNTDFAETEVDERRVNLTRFPLFFPEKRDFFLEDAQIFSFGGIRRNPLPFQSRRIGLGPSGEINEILAGAKLTGKIENLNLGILAVQMKDDPVLGDKTFLVGRASADVLDESTLGLIFTNGNPRGLEENSVAGIDFLFRNSNFLENRVLTASAFVLGSSTTGPVGEDYTYGFKLNYPNDRINWGIGFSEIGTDFNAALGFVPRPGIREYFGNWRYRLRPQSGPIRRIDSGVRGTFITDLDDRTESRSLNFEIFTLEFNSLDRIFANADLNREVLTNPFRIASNVTIPTGDYHDTRAQIGFRTSESRPYSVNVSVRNGTFFTGDRRDIFLGFEARPSKYIFAGLEFEQNDIDLPQGQFETEIARLRLNFAFNPDVSWTNFAQFDNVSESIGLNSRIRWIVEPGNEIFFVINQGFNIDDGNIDLATTEITTKIGWTFRF